jgi:shikimate kinase
MQRHVLLVGLPGCGKSTVGRLAADGLAAPLIDIDGLLVREMGMPISQIFGMVGEARFREMERDAVNAAQGGNPGVIVPGGGWAAQPGQLEAALASSLVVYLKCQPATAAEPGRRNPATARRSRPGPADAGAAAGTGTVLPAGVASSRCGAWECGSSSE